MSEFFEKIAKGYHLPPSEIMRIFLGISILASTEGLFPESDIGMRVKDSIAVRDKLAKLDRIGQARWWEKFFFEVQKAVEFRLQNDPLLKDESE
jgi:hypothetical protein